MDNIGYYEDRLMEFEILSAEGSEYSIAAMEEKIAETEKIINGLNILLKDESNFGEKIKYRILIKKVGQYLNKMREYLEPFQELETDIDTRIRNWVLQYGAKKSNIEQYSKALKVVYQHPNPKEVNTVVLIDCIFKNYPNFELSDKSLYRCIPAFLNKFNFS